MPGSEVVQGDEDAQLPQLAQPVRHRFRAPHRDPLVDLQHDPSWRDGCLEEQLRDPFDQPRIPERLDRVVDGDPLGLLSSGPLAGLKQGALQDPAIDLLDEAAALGQPDERLGGEYASLRMVPANQRLGTDEPTILQADDRLIVEGQLGFLDRGAKLLLLGELVRLRFIELR